MLQSKKFLISKLLYNLIDLVNKEFSAQIKNLERRREQENEKIKAAEQAKKTQDKKKK